jgi:hypothetical protein
VLFHRDLGPVLTASMTAYQMIEIANQQAYRDNFQMELTPRIECAVNGETFTSVNDLKAALTALTREGAVAFSARGRLLTPARRAPTAGDIAYRLGYTFTAESVELAAGVGASDPMQARFLVPVLVRSTERVEQPDPQTVRITKPAGTLTIRVDRPAAFEPIPAARTFNLVPGFEAVPLSILLPAGVDVRVRLEASPA